MRKVVWISTLTAVFALLMLTLGGYLWYTHWKADIMKIPPKAPTNLVAEPLSATEVRLTWVDNSDSELGFKIVRNGQVIRYLSQDVEEYVDRELKPATNYDYQIKAYNQAGESDTMLYSVKTLNPPIIVWIDKIGVHENGEEGELFREFSLLGEPGEGEIQVGLIVSDSKNTIEKRLPEKGCYKLKRDQVIQVNSLLFESKEVGDYLRFFATAYEDDGGLGEQMIYKVLDIATGSYIGMPTSILLTLSGVDFAKLYGELFGAEDDWLGTYVSEWTSSDNWGVGKYDDVECKKDDGDVGLRLWFRIECPVYDYSSGECTP
jgi:hypothetical protein